jgi:hypothetical protein
VIAGDRWYGSWQRARPHAVIRYEQEYPGRTVRWDPDLIRQIADEASLSSTKTKQKLQAASCFSHFHAEFEDKLPGDEEFSPGTRDYFLFENIVKSRWLRGQFSMGEDDRHLPKEKEQVLFDWTFKYPRGRTADENPNVLERHQNLQEWERIKRYDDQHGTAFAQRLDVEHPDDAPRFAQIQADYLAHKSRTKPVEVIENLLQQLGSIDTETIMSEGTFLEHQLQRLQERTGTLLRMVQVAAAV